ncbi:MAG: hypothetical protein RRY99_08750 [Flavobacterium sp.]
MKNNITLTILIFLFKLNCYSQENKLNFDLSTSTKSFEILCSLLNSKDTINLKKVVTKECYKSFNLNNLNGLQDLAKDWKGKKTKTTKSTDTEEILKIETYYIPLRFIKEPESKDWKFSTFVLKP